MLSPLTLPIAHGFKTTPSTYYFDVSIVPTPTFPLPSPGITLTLPMVTFTTPGTTLQLFRVDPSLGLVAATDVHGNAIFGTVSNDGMSAVFPGVSHFSVHVALQPTGAIPGDVNDDGKVDCADVAIVKAAFGSRLGQPGFDPRADVNNDNVVNVLDLAFVTRLLPAGTVCSATSSPHAIAATSDITPPLAGPPPGSH